MSRRRKSIMEYRNYVLPADFPLLVLDGPQWHISPVPSRRLHFHNCLEIGICHSGNGEMILGERSVSFRAGDVTVIGQNVPHTTWSAPETYSLWSYVYVDLGAMLKPFTDNLLADFQIYQDMIFNGHFLLAEDSCSWAGNLVRDLIQECLAKSPGYELYVRSLLLVLTLRLQRLYANHPERISSQRNLITISPALNYIQACYAQDFPMEHLAEVCRLSPTHFRRLFHSLMGIAPLAYLHQVRIYNSCNLLRTTDRSIAEVAAQAGYASLSVFNRHFLEIIGSTPSAWRKAGLDSDQQPALITASGWVKAETDEEIVRSGDGFK